MSPSPTGTPYNSNPQSGLVAGVLNWFAHPFQTQGSALNWVLWVGLLIVAVWFWNHILMSITD